MSALIWYYTLYQYFFGGEDILKLAEGTERLGVLFGDKIDKIGKSLTLGLAGMKGSWATLRIEYLAYLNSLWSPQRPCA
jgi:hypothetical protein